jgi:hypothetical protein
VDNEQIGNLPYRIRSSEGFDEAYFDLISENFPIANP